MKAFAEKLEQSMLSRNSLVCVGIDPDPAQMPSTLSGLEPAAAMLEFNCAIVTATLPYACAFKANLGFFLRYGSAGVDALIAMRQSVLADVPVILDCKVADIGSTSIAYADAYFTTLGFEAVTVNPYLGEDALEPFLKRPDVGVFVLCKTSNPGSDNVQDQRVSGDEKIFERVATSSAGWQNCYPATVGLVAGATWPSHLASVRRRCPDQPILMPGVGAQAGGLDAAVRAGVDSRGRGLLVSASRSILYASNGEGFAAAAADAARNLRDAINEARHGPG